MASMWSTFFHNGILLKLQKLCVALVIVFGPKSEKWNIQCSAVKFWQVLQAYNEANEALFFTGILIQDGINPPQVWHIHQKDLLPMLWVPTCNHYLWHLFMQIRKTTFRWVNLFSKGLVFNVPMNVINSCQYNRNRLVMPEKKANRDRTWSFRVLFTLAVLVLLTVLTLMWKIQWVFELFWILGYIQS